MPTKAHDAPADTSSDRTGDQPDPVTAPEAAPKRVTPAMRQYFRFKEKHPDCVLFFRMGDFYEMFYDDAVAANKALGITLTERSPGVPMAGVPHHAVDAYLKRMLEQGFRVAICEQIQDPKEAKGVVERAVTRIITPGTLTDEALLRDEAPNNLAAVCFLDAGDDPEGRAAAAIIEVSTGAFALLDGSLDRLADELARRGVSEILFAQTADNQTPPRAQRLLDSLEAPGVARPSWHFAPFDARDALCEQFHTSTLEGFGLADADPAIPAAGAIIRYLRETQNLAADVDIAIPGRTSSPTLAHLAPPSRLIDSDRLVLDATTLRSLEIERTIRAAGVDGSLLGVFTGAGACRTPMGKRLLRDWLTGPLADRAAIEARHTCVATLIEDPRCASELRAAAQGVQDVARIAGRLGLGRATPRDLVALGRSLAQLDDIIAAIDNAPAFAAQRASIVDTRAALTPIAIEIQSSCVDAPPAHLREGGVFRDGVDARLDEARSLQRDASTWLSDYQRQLIAEHNLPAIKVGYNRVFGYYIELSRANAAKAPDTFTRKQTLKNAERYITPELKAFEHKVLTARSSAIEREQTLFGELCQRVAQLTQPLAQFAAAVAELDVLTCFADRARRRGWVQPTMIDEPELDIEQGCHPVLEEILGDRFTPNDVRLGATESPARLTLITGPNMAGKSTYIRQTALLVILSHAGSFVPADRARIGVVDRIFTRIGADDALHAGQSTFMVEMIETARILHSATPQSLVILDEIGRGTSTLDGLSLAWAIAERLAEPSSSERGAGPRTLFATHYHELTDLQERLPGLVANANVVVREWGEEIVFLHRVAPGRADRSYGVHVARLAGMPESVVRRARELLERLSVSHDEPGAALIPAPDAQAKDEAPRSAQLGLFIGAAEHPILDELRAMKLDAMTPLEAFDALRTMRDQLDAPR